jgi:hypothetical protein
MGNLRGVAGRLIRLLVKAAALVAAVWMARSALVRWIDGPRREPSRQPWPPIGGSLDEHPGGPPTADRTAAATPVAPAVETVLAAGGETGGTPSGRSVATPRVEGAASGAPAAEVVAPGAATAAPAAGAVGPEPESATPANPAVPASVAETVTARVGKGRSPSAGQRQTSAGASWLRPDGSGDCPDTHPVKAKLSSRVYRLPGTAAYGRSRADRCYTSAEAAEADGFTRAKR